MMLKPPFKVATAVLALSLPAVKGDPFIAGLSNDTAQPFLEEHVPNAFALRLDTIGGKGGTGIYDASNPLIMQVKEDEHFFGLVRSRLVQFSKPNLRLHAPRSCQRVPPTTWPGPTIIARSNEKLFVKWENKIDPGPHVIRPLDNANTTGAVDVVDTSLHWAYSLPKTEVNGTNYTYSDYSIASNGTPVVPHLHGGHTGTSF